MREGVRCSFAVAFAPFIYVRFQWNHLESLFGIVEIDI